MLDYSGHYQEVKIALRALLVEEQKHFSEADILEINNFLEAREYGLALETFAAAMLELPTDFSESTVTSVRKMATDMGMFDEQSINGLLVRYEHQTYKIAM